MGNEVNIAKKYEDYYEIYDQVVIRMLPFYSDMHTEIIQTFARDRSEKINVLELGFGTGTLTYRILKEYPNAKLVGVDNQQNNIAKVEKKLKPFPGFSYIMSDIKNFVTAELFDVVVSSLTIHHLSDQEKE